MMMVSGICGRCSLTYPPDCQHLQLRGRSAALELGPRAGSQPVGVPGSPGTPRTPCSVFPATLASEPHPGRSACSQGGAQGQWPGCTDITQGPAPSWPWLGGDGAAPVGSPRRRSSVRLQRIQLENRPHSEAGDEAAVPVVTRPWTGGFADDEGWRSPGAGVSAGSTPSPGPVALEARAGRCGALARDAGSAGCPVQRAAGHRPRRRIAVAGRARGGRGRVPDRALPSGPRGPKPGGGRL